MTTRDLIDTLDSSSISYQKQHLLDRFRNHTNNSVKYYFDSYDIIKMIEGLRTFENDYFVQGSEMDDRETLVRALAYFGWLDSKKIGVLLGHQDELFFTIKTKIGPTESEFDESFINDLFYKIELKKFNFEEAINEEELEIELSKLKHQSTRLFKTNYILDKSNWLDRADYLINNRVTFDEYVKVDNITSNLLFKTLHKYFLMKRPSSTMLHSNFMDALSLFSIANKLKDFKNKKTNEIPIFYASTQIMKDIRNNNSLNKHFVVNILNEEFFIIQDSEFIVLDTLFNKTSKKDSFLSQFIAYDNLSNRTKKLNIYEQQIYNDTFNNIEFKFFEKFWFRERGKKNLTKAIKELVQYGFIEKNDLIKSERKEQQQQILNKISVNEHNLKLMSQTWTATESFIKKSNNFNFSTYSGNPFMEFGLTRFSFKNWRVILNYINDIVFKSIQDDKEKLQNFQGNFISMLYKAISKDNFSKLEIIVSVLWVFGEYQIILNILKPIYENNKKELSFPLSVIYGASSVKNRVRVNKVMKIIKTCENAKNTTGKEYKRKIGISFMYFRLWNRENESIYLIPELNNMLGKKTVLHEYAEKSIELLKNSTDWLSNNKDKIDSKKKYRNLKFVYSLNNYIYYITRNGSETLFNSIQDYFILFFRQSNYGIYWQNRYNDTISLYYLRKAILDIDSNEKFTSNIDSAQRHSELAVDTGISDRDNFEQTRDTIFYVEKKHNKIKEFMSKRNNHS